MNLYSIKKTPVLVAVLVACLLGFLPVGAQESVLRVAAAASLTDSLKEINTLFEKKHGAKVELNLGASSTLARQIEEGASIDVFFSADEAKMQGLAQKGLVREATKINLLSNTLVIVVPVDSKLKINSVADLAKPFVGRIATGNPKAVPVGVYAKEYLAKKELWNAVSPKIVGTESVRSALSAVESGNVDAGIVYKTDALISKKVKISLEIPASEGPRIVYPIAVLEKASQAGLAQKYLDYMTSQPAKDIFIKYGFTFLKK